MPAVNPVTGRPGPAPKPARDNDRVQARQRVNVEVRSGRRPHPNELPCADCGHTWRAGERRHEYDHHMGYAAGYHLVVQPVCTICHSHREARANVTHCVHGHEYTEANTGRKANGTRFCIECRRARDRRRKRPVGYWSAVNARRRAK